ncbi:MAG: Uncharacterized conserved protein, contains ferritin-like DUF455 domain [Verrucomicrobia bacterium]|nr:MAG: Uncharacterized conserved protein, contains ferritin-like DUF455 domain [Verrucomicrobiota bacterium]
MELREFAERVLYATSLTEKLAGPETAVTDVCPGRAVGVPDQPGRPENLRFCVGEEGPPLPRGAVLRDDLQRAVLLHFFANHELLATELMALILLRFPEAPGEFRRGLCATLREEQRHTGWYLRRLEACGLRFGDLPVNRYFWDAVAPVESPMDYVARLSLTFEQANLDYSLHYAGVFERSGDEKSAAVLRAICRDEVGHVRYGLNWFRRWRDPALSEWEAYQKALPFPLSPSRAKGNGAAIFNRRGRLEAGLEPDFVRRLELFERSKGRTPAVFWFCPGAEESVRGEPDGLREDAAARSVALSVEPLMMFVCRRDDVMLLRRLPDVETLEKLVRAGFVLPELEELGDDGRLRPDSVLRGRKIAALRPWGWCAAAAGLLEPLEAGLPLGAPGLARSWNPKIRELYAKTADQAFLRRFLEEEGAVPGVDPGVVGRTVGHAGELWEAVEEFRRAGHEEIVFKAPFAAAGRGNRRFLRPADLVWAERQLARQGALVVEPWLERVWDFSVQFEMQPDGLRRLEWIELQNDPRGQFQAASCGPRPTRGLEAGLARFLHERVFPLYDGALAKHLANHLERAGFLGAIGVDALVYRDRSGELRCKPVVEINPRYTMGRIAAEIRRQVAPGCSVRLSLVRSGECPGDDGVRLDPKSGRMDSGRLVLTSGAGPGGFASVLEISPAAKS